MGDPVPKGTAPQGTVPKDPVLAARGLVREFRGFRAVDGVDLDVAEGSVHALVGPNGAGKTTLFNLLTGFLKPTAGSVRLGGQELAGRSPERIARLGLARSFQITSLFAELTPRQHVELALAGRSGLGWRFWRSDRALGRYSARAAELLEQVGLAGHGEVPAGALAYGRKRALELALALALDPKVLLLDEPTAGMGVEDVDRTVALIERVREGRTVVLVEHNMSVVSDLADRVTVLQHGQVLVEGPYAEIRHDPRVVTAYLGDSHADR
ncbi:amino acid/amide ABC transporter ATP-binding protein 1 (HAAT family) [Actinomadura hallensis]|uniref:Amino acid/amide ABC transporter ATP-binding protein 1 (HAAT family) n=1 Tax=Actinomadura hallensis TaxID=337895 RepID=A0A543IC90_9ACTN|nr:ABC transporter ATP-binding protein [Actinomadura hallensis]TQM68160.1 amino acid/amide ABC transporter ATP-binding protein 1 (HAAT family) [Actinomadura hallensis]